MTLLSFKSLRENMFERHGYVFFSLYLHLATGFITIQHDVFSIIVLSL